MIELNGTRDLFGRLLCLSNVQNVDFEKVFAYLLTPVTLSLAHGSNDKTDKTKLLHKIEAMVDSTPPPDVTDVKIADAMFILHTMQKLSGTFGELVQLVLCKLCQMSYWRVDLVCDTYSNPSIKDFEHRRRWSDDATYNISGPQQKCSQDWQMALRSSLFKIFFQAILDWSCRHQRPWGWHCVLRSKEKLLLLCCSIWKGFSWRGF